VGSGAYSASYDALGRLTNSQDSYIPAGGSASTLYQAQPTYDALSNVIATTTTLPQGVDTQVFCYDDLSRLTWAGSRGTPACSGAPTPSDTGSLAGTGAAYSASYSYDPLNHLISSPLGSYSYGDTAHVDAATAIGASWTASYDAAGNMTCRAATSATTCAGASPTGAQLSYDNEGRLAAWQSTPTTPLQSASFLYDGAGNRVEQVASAGGGATTTTSYLGSLEEVTTSGSGTTTTAYYGGLAESVNGTRSYTLSDGLGSVSEAVNTSDGSVTATQLYGPYGGVRYQNGVLPTSKGFTGQRADASTSGLDYYGARYYDPVAGQFTSADTWLSGGLNRYAYVGDSPEVFIDPSGHELRDGEDGGEGGGIFGAEGSDVGGSGGENGANETGLQAPSMNGTELTYGTDDASAVHFDAPEGQNGPMAGVDGPDGQVLETNAQIEAQAEANAQDRLNQGDQPHGDDGQSGEGTANSQKIPPIKQGTHDGPTSGKSFPTSVREAAFKADPSKTCVYCGREGEGLQVDHAYPKANGGDATQENAQLACGWCNRSKSNRFYPLNPPPSYEGEWPPSFWPEWLLQLYSEDGGD